MRIKLIVLIFLLVGVGYAQASDKELVGCIVGEASNQGEVGMYALASGLLNRIDNMGYDKALKGVYGCRAKHAKNEPAYVWDIGYNALAKAKVKRLHDADHWENIKAFSTPSWAYKMELVYQYKDHWFYKNK